MARILIQAPAMDAIFVEDLRLDAWVGIYPRERVAAQTVEIQLEIGLPEDATHSDDIQHTIDYAAVVARLEQEFSERHFNLLETMAEWIADTLLQEFGALWVKVSVAKIGVLKNTRRVGVRLERSK